MAQSAQSKKNPMKTAEQPTGQSAWQKNATSNSKLLSVWKLEQSSSKDGTGIILQGRKWAKAYRNQTHEQHPTELRKCKCKDGISEMKM